MNLIGRDLSNDWLLPPPSFNQPLFSWPLQTLALPTLGCCAPSDYGIHLSSAPRLFLLRQMESGAGEGGRKRSRMSEAI